MSVLFALIALIFAVAAYRRISALAASIEELRGLRLYVGRANLREHKSLQERAIANEWTTHWEPPE